LIKVKQSTHPTDTFQLINWIALWSIGGKPQPSSGQFQLAFGQYVEDLTITIRDITGRTVSNQSANGQEVVFTQIDEAPGIYLVHIIADGKQTIRKVIKK